MDLKSPSDNIHPIRGGRGIQEAQVWEAADVLLLGEHPFLGVCSAAK